MSLASTLKQEDEKILACIHCGLCLEACPTYVLTGDENDGPRGRIYLMRAVAEGRLANTSEAFERHIDRCLGCRACEQVCPAGVEYGQLLEAGRAELFQGKQSTTSRILRFVLRHIWLHRNRLKFAFAASRLFRDAGLARLLLKTKLPKRISSRFEFALALLQSSKGQGAATGGSAGLNKVNKTSSTPLMLFKGCVGEGLFGRVNLATRRVLNANGFDVSEPEKQVCCGALHAHAGDLEGAKELARRNIEAFEAADEMIITNAGGCGAMLATYDHLLSDDPSFRVRAELFSRRVRDVSALIEVAPKLPTQEQPPNVVTYDASCHLMYGQHAAESSLDMVRSVSDLRFAPLRDYERCCGGAGIYNLLEPGMSQEVLRQKLASIKESRADILATGNPGCQMHIGAGAMLAGMHIRICHPVELLDESYAREGRYQDPDE